MSYVSTVTVWDGVDALEPQLLVSWRVCFGSFYVVTVKLAQPVPTKPYFWRTVWTAAPPGSFRSSDDAADQEKKQIRAFCYTQGEICAQRLK